MQNTLNTDNNPGPHTGLPLKYTSNGTHWEKIIYSCYIATIVHYQSATFITNEICNANLYPYHGKYILPKSYRRIIFCKYYISYQIDADYKSYIETFYDYSPHVSY